MRGRGRGDGSSSTARECGFVMGAHVLVAFPSPFVRAVFGPSSGACGGDVPSLFWSFCVMCGRD